MVLWKWALGMVPWNGPLEMGPWNCPLDMGPWNVPLKMGPLSIPWMTDEYEALVNNRQGKTEIPESCLRTTMSNKNPVRTAFGWNLHFRGEELGSSH
jgi:hypothetical protein